MIDHIGPSTGLRQAQHDHEAQQRSTKIGPTVSEKGMNFYYAYTYKVLKFCHFSKNKLWAWPFSLLPLVETYIIAVMLNAKVLPINKLNCCMTKFKNSIKSRSLRVFYICLIFTKEGSERGNFSACSANCWCCGRLFEGAITVLSIMHLCQRFMAELEEMHHKQNGGFSKIAFCYSKLEPSTHPLFSTQFHDLD